jgi:hypothetical protein
MSSSLICPNSGRMYFLIRSFEITCVEWYNSGNRFPYHSFRMLSIVVTTGAGASARSR